MPTECSGRNSNDERPTDVRIPGGVPLPASLPESTKLPSPIFTPATETEVGHDENISFE